MGKLFKAFLIIYKNKTSNICQRNGVLGVSFSFCKIPKLSSILKKNQTQTIKKQTLKVTEQISLLNHRNTKSQKHFGWKTPSKSLSPTMTTITDNHSTKCHTQSLLEHLQWWWLHNLLGQPIPRPFHEEILPDVQPDPPLVQLEAISSHFFVPFLGEPTPTWVQLHFRHLRVIKFLPEFSLLQAKHPGDLDLSLQDLHSRPFTISVGLHQTCFSTFLTFL